MCDVSFGLLDIRILGGLRVVGFSSVCLCINTYMFRLRGWLHGFSLLPDFQ